MDTFFSVIRKFLYLVPSLSTPLLLLACPLHTFKFVHSDNSDSNKRDFRCDQKSVFRSPYTFFFYFFYHQLNPLFFIPEKNKVFIDAYDFSLYSLIISYTLKSPPLCSLSHLTSSLSTLLQSYGSCCLFFVSRHFFIGENQSL